jgi:hypothetical protein
MLDDLARSARWHGQADPDITAIGADDRAVHTDRFATHVDQGAARVPRVDRRIGLDVASAAVGRAAQPADDSRRDGLPHLERVAYGDHIVTDLRLVRVTQRKLFQPASWNAQHGDVGPRIAAEKLGFDLPITNANGNGAGILDDMVVGDNQTARGIEIGRASCRERVS